MEIHPVDILISVINIIVLFFLLRLILWKHIIRYLSERSERIQKEIDEAAAMRRDAEALQAEFKQKITGIEEIGQGILQESRKQASEEAELIIEEAKEVTKKMLRDAELRIEIEKAQAFKDTQSEIAQLATEMAARILEREVSKADNVRTVNDFFEEM